MATLPMRPADKWRRPEPKRENLGQIKITDRWASVFNDDPTTPHTLYVDVSQDDLPTPACIHCPEPFAPGHKAYCVYHKKLIDAEPWPPPRSEPPFTPSAEWQEVPDGYRCPPGGEFRLDFKTGKNWARRPVRSDPAAMAGGSE